MNLDEIQRRSREVFRLEAADLLRELETALLELEGDPQDPALIDRVFRVMHTLKGSGATTGFQELADFLHHVEDVYNAGRERRLQINSRIIDLTLKIGDVVSRHLTANPDESSAVLEAAAPTLAALLDHLPKASGAAATSSAPKPAKRNSFHIKFRPHPEIFCRGSDPGMFLDDLRALGECTVRGLSDDLPCFDQLQPEACYLRWEIDLTTDADEDAVRSVFMFVEDDCDLTITAGEPVSREAPPVTSVSPRSWEIEFFTTATTMASPGVLESLWTELSKLGDYRVVASPILLDGVPLPGFWKLRLATSASLDAIHDAFLFLPDTQPKIQPEPELPAEPASQSVPETKVTPASAPASEPSPESKTVEKPKSGERTETAASETLRVSSDRLDKLVNLVGELVILRSQVTNVCANMTEVPSELQSVSEALQTLTAEMRDVILNIRMMPLEQTFSKFRRLVRDLSRELGKEVDLVIEGAETEIDKTMLDALNDPLMHLVRNSLDHGLELPDDRVATGKARRGTLRLKAEQRGDRVVVSVSDDGRGLDTEKIRTKAIARGLLPADARPTETELFQLIFLPGFSTADTVSKLSGRGVGLDVVHRQIERLRGKVEVRSERNRGAEFSLSLPLTLAIIEGLMVEVDGDRHILPLGNARETIEVTKSQRLAGNGRNMVEIRGELVPYLRLRDLFELNTPSPETERVVIVELENHQRLGICVDRVLGNHQTVLKSLGWLGRRAKVFAGATVLGDGRIALILDISALLSRSKEMQGIGQGLEV